MKINPTLLNWLLEENNPGVQLRTLTGLCKLPQDDEKVILARRRVMQTLPQARDLSWMQLKGQVLVYNLTALAESGLSRADVPIEPLVNRIQEMPFDVNCGEMMLLRALVMLGFIHEAHVQDRIKRMAETQLPDGGWLCLHRLKKLHRTPKSCIKANMHALLLASELHRLGETPGWSGPLIDYFRKRRLFYRMDDPAQLVLGCKPGYRMVDIYVPIEFLRVGLTFLMAALAELGQQNTPEFQMAWQLLEEKKDEYGRVKLEGTLAKSYLAKEPVGQPTKWGTLHACFASG